MSQPAGQPGGGDPRGVEVWPLVRRFLESLEANAEDYWEVPRLEGPQQGRAGEQDREEGLFEAAYEGVTYRDTTDDSEDAVSEGGPPAREFDLEMEADVLIQRLQFLTTVARLWHIAAQPGDGQEVSDRQETLAHWQGQAQARREQLLQLLDSVHAFPVPRPVGAFEELVEYDRRRLLKEQLLHAIISTSLETEMALGALEGASAALPGQARTQPYSSSWGAQALELERAVLARDLDGVRRALPAFLAAFREEPLLFQPLSEGGSPRQILRARLAQTLIRALLSLLPRLGLFRETFHVLRTAQDMERAHPPLGHGVTEFNGLFQTAFQGVVECLADSSDSWGLEQGTEVELVGLLNWLTAPFLNLWIDHSRTLQLSSLEMVRSDQEWAALGDFVRRYGRDLFDVRFLTLANLRGILHHGVGSYLDYLRDNPDPLHPIKLLEDLDRTISRQEAVARLGLIIQAVVENYEEYRDYNATTSQSDYGENLYVLLDFLRLKAAYERQAWNFRPLVMAHDVLARWGCYEAALLWEEEFARLAEGPAADFLARLAALEREHRVRLGTVADRLGERLVKTLAQDRLCALVEPAMEEASRPGERPAFGQLRQELRELAATPAGPGLDAPAWLRRLEAEVHRVRAASSPMAQMVENIFQVPQRTIGYEELKQQLQTWDQPLGS